MDTTGVEGWPGTGWTENSRDIGQKLVRVLVEGSGEEMGTSEEERLSIR